MAIVKYIVSQAIVDINSREKCNRTPLMMAARSDYRDVFAFLVSAGAVYHCVIFMVTTSFTAPVLGDMWRW